MGKIILTIEVDPEAESVRVEGENAMLFYTVWEGMIRKAKIEALNEALGVCEDIWHIEQLQKLKSSYECKS